jgi:DNA polymerase phi
MYQACIDATTRMFASGSKKNKKSRKSTDQTDAEPTSEPIDVLVDSIIGLLEQSTAYLRSVANQAFSLLSSAVQKTTVDLILTVSFMSSLATVGYIIAVSNWNAATLQNLR